MPSDCTPTEAQINTLKRLLHITPKTARLLIQAGYADYTALANVSPSHVSKQFQVLLNLSDKHAYSYKRALRQVVWLGTQSHPEKLGKDCRNWSDKALRARGVWCEGFDSLTGREIDGRLKSEKGGKKVGTKVKRVKEESADAIPEHASHKQDLQDVSG
jgi:hypothetical protein